MAFKNAETARVVFPGTFDPVTNGHKDLIERATHMFSEVIVAVAAIHSEKKPLFDLKERVDLMRQCVKGLSSVSVESFDGLIVNFAREHGARAMIRGVRMLTDFEYEFQMALTNRQIAPDIETVFLMPNESFAYLSSRHIKEIASLGGDIRSFVPPHVEKALLRKLKK